VGFKEASLRVITEKSDEFYNGPPSKKLLSKSRHKSIDQMGRPPALTPAQQKEATQRRARGAALDELARSYNVGISTIRRATRPAV
jgi:hypothetical protein